MSKNFKPNERGWADLERALAFGMLNLGFAVEAGAKERCPYKTGNLRRSIHTATFNRGQRVFPAAANDANGRSIPDYAVGQGITAVVGTNAGYGVYVELGTVHARAQPFLSPAMAAVRGNASRLVSEGMKRKQGAL